MRLHFPDREHADVEISSGRLTLGRGEGVEVRIDSDKLAERHVHIDYEPLRGLSLEIATPGAEVQVNGRKVAQRAIVRLGDVLTVAGMRVLLSESPGVRPPPPKAVGNDNETIARHQAQRALLRGVAGPHFGKIITLKQRTVIGRGEDCDLVLNEPEMSRRHALIENGPDGLLLRDLGSRNGSYVNGVAVRDAVLKPGDQIAFDLNRFLVEAPGYVAPDRHSPPPPVAAHTGVHRPISIPAPPAVQAARAREQAQQEARESQLANYVLIGAAVVILVSLAAVAVLSLQRG